MKNEEKDVASLECYICGDENLSEDGDCYAQFRYDCTNYAKSFEPAELIYCRTMRKRIGNGTYTTMKECISEQDHYRLFPPKQHSFDEDCNLIEIDGVELAYCICRRNFCNMKNILNQFTDFEENHPEIFVPPKDDSISDKSSERFPILSQSYPTQMIYQSIRNSHQELANIPYGILNSMQSDKRFNGDSVGETNSNYISTTSRNTSRLLHQIPNYPSEESYYHPSAMVTGTVVTNISVGKNKHSGGTSKTIGRFTAPKQIATFHEIEQQNTEINKNFCYSCTEYLNDPTEDCLGAMVIQCSISTFSGRSKMCLTKQTFEADTKLYKLEKRCSTDIEESEISFDELLTRKITCTKTFDATQAYCLCLGSYCNGDSLLEQVEKLVQSIDESRPLINSISDENTDSVLSQANTQSKIPSNNEMLISTISYGVAPFPNLVSKSNAWTVMESMEKDNIVSNIASINYSTAHSITMTLITIVLSSLTS
ncbi:unnamed protein product [Litomosoides sigmodontis]|uniref:Uncharacterized protein n=1 Tax=Litomosoides sigmodontis TaxID=42156 RepID=A0A3P6U472_LITSI|nr:unnamed protein product [Litomosoides sigmodontis]